MRSSSATTSWTDAALRRAQAPRPSAGSATGRHGRNPLMRFWLGGYTADGEGSASGIGALVAGAPDDALAGGQLSFGGTSATTGGSPSWLAAHPTLDVVYAALEDAGAVRAFRRTGPSSLAPLGGGVAGGEALCHIAVAPDGRSE